jgi:hypothetical protein
MAYYKEKYEKGDGRPEIGGQRRRPRQNASEAGQQRRDSEKPAEKAEAARRDGNGLDPPSAKREVSPPDPREKKKGLMGKVLGIFGKKK